MKNWNKMNFEGVKIAEQIQLMEMPYPEEISIAEMINYCSSTIKLRIRENGIFLVL